MSSTMPERAYLDAPYGCEDDYDSGVWCVKKDRLCNTEYVRTDCAQDYPAYKREKKIRCGLEKQLATANAEIERLRAKVDAS